MPTRDGPGAYERALWASLTRLEAMLSAYGIDPWRRTELEQQIRDTRERLAEIPVYGPRARRRGKQDHTDE